MKLTKKQLIIIISAVVLLALTATVAIILITRDKPDERTVYYHGDFSYVIRDDGRLEIVSYSGSSSDVVIPSAIDSRSVASIGEGAFLGNKMKTLKLGTFVTEIKDSAFHSCTSLETVTWSSALTSIDKYAFYMCVALKSADLPSTVSFIGEAAFADCSSLESISLSERVTSVSAYLFYNCTSLTSFDSAFHIDSIGDYAFSGCTSLASVNVDGVKSFGSHAFEGCTSLESLTIDASVGYIGDGILFGASNVASFTVEEGNVRYSTSSGALVDTVDGVLMYMPPKSGIVSYEFPEKIRSIDDYAFNNCLSLTSVILSDTLETIGSYAFNLCDNLFRIALSGTDEGINCDFPSTLTSIGGLAFFNTKFKENLPSGFTIVGDGILIDFKPYVDATGNYKEGEGASVVERLVDKGGYSVNEIFGVSVTVPDGVKSISSAFAYNNDVVEVSLPSTVGVVSDYAFYSALRLEKIDMSTTGITHLSDYCLGKTTRLGSVSLPSSLRTTGQMVFAGASILKDIVLPGSLEEIGHSMFFECSGLENIYIPESVKSIGEYAFSRTLSLKTISLPDSIEKIGKYAFGESGLIEFTVPDVEIGDYLLFSCESLVKVTVLGSGESPFGLCMACTSLTDVTFDGKFTLINDDTFAGCTSLKEVTLPRSVKIIGNTVFDGCSSLEVVKVKGRLAEIGNSAFYGVSKMENFKFTRSLKKIGPYAFFGCSSLAEVDLKHVTEIGNSAFEYCSSIEKVNLKGLEHSVPSRIFAYCVSLSEVKLASSVTEIGRAAFISCQGITGIKLPKSLTVIGTSAFAGC